MDPGSLRTILSSTDVTPATVQSSSRAMMRHYDHNPIIAVNEWRNSIQTCSETQLLPLLYVANEVLQTSKRNRGNRFLEAFSPVLGTSARFICERDRSIVEKVRRVIKIWGDRRVFSVRYVGEILSELNNLRSNVEIPPPPVSTNTHTHGKSRPNVTPTSPVHSDDDDQSSDSDASSMFASTGPSLLQLDVNILEKTKTSTTTTSSQHGLLSPRHGRKRARGHFEDTHESSVSPHKRHQNTPAAPKSKVYSTSTLLDLLKRTEDLAAQFQSSLGAVEGCPASHFSTDPDSVSDLVGDDLVHMDDAVRCTGRLLTVQRVKMHRIARERRELETDAVKFIPFLKDSLKQDDDELKFCDEVEKKIKLLAVVIDDSRAVREKKRVVEEEERNKVEAEIRRKEEEAERKKSLETAMKEKANEPGQVYNPATRSYQYVHDHTEDDWRN